MKKLLLLLAFVSLFTFISCSSDDETPPQNVLLNGKWNLVKVTCDCEPLNYDKGEHVWFIDVGENLLTILNNVEGKPHTLMPSGLYTAVESEDKIRIETTTYDFSITNGVLTLSDMPASGGPVIEFVRD